MEDGKYTFFTPANDYQVHVLRHGQPWHIIGPGCNAVRALMHRVEELEKEVAELQGIAACPGCGNISGGPCIC